ncbi:hypothetical protein [Terriglobus sp.]|uniref:hypothetical protein n=1 Tax=Terriglobus sp. TaxID=1889013 RepID=UPI003B00EFF8
MNKINIKNSSLATVLCQLWNQHDSGGSVKNRVINARVNLSIVGGLKDANADEVREFFGTETSAGLYSRFILVPGPTCWDWDMEWVPPAKRTEEVYGWQETPVERARMRVTVPKEIHALVKAWHEKKKETRGRFKVRLAGGGKEG